MHEREDEDGRSYDDEIHPAALMQRLRAGAMLTLLDVREPYEWKFSRLPEARLIPLGTLPDHVDSLDQNAEYVVYCHHGIRSAAAVVWMRERGFARVSNLTGGIDRWSLDVDPAVRRY